MSRFRDIKRQARLDLHEELQVEAYYIGTPDSTPVPCTVRVHTSFNALGDQKGTNFNSAEMLDRQPEIIFLRSEIPEPKRGAIVSVEPGEAYRVGVIHPADGITIKADIVPMQRAETVGLPVPGDA
ncbi:MAG: hypothetical protein DI537_19160 [Stutzerimonas stutzeri]|nr:MAG: hypothetical protein DI537_19160 [Stutzerimonas stutzeri]